jgi:hypothetical protein
LATATLRLNFRDGSIRTATDYERNLMWYPFEDSLEILKARNTDEAGAPVCEALRGISPGPGESTSENNVCLRAATAAIDLSVVYG